MADVSCQFGQGSNKLRLIEGKEKVSQTGCGDGEEIHPEQALI